MSFETVLLSSFAGRPDARREIFRSALPLRKFVDEFDLQPKHEVTPTRLLPGNQFRAALPPAEWLGSTGMPPFRSVIEVPGLSPVNISTTPVIDCYGPDLVVVQLRHVGTYTVASLDDLLSVHAGVQEAIASGVGVRILRAVAATAVGADLQGVGKVRKHSLIEVGRSSEAKVGLAAEIAEYIDRNRDALITLHIAGSPHATIDPRLRAEVEAKNASLNLKAEDQFLVLNAQGSTLFKSRSSTSSGEAPAYHNRHERVAMLSSIGTAMQHILVRTQRSNSSWGGDWGANQDVVRRWVQFPKSVFSSSVSNQVIWSVISEQFGLPEMLEEVLLLDRGGEKSTLSACSADADV